MAARAPAVLKRNGWKCPPAPLQVVSWVVFLLFISSFYAVFLPTLMDEAGRWALGSFYGVTAAVVVGLSLVLTSTDPKDPMVEESKRGKGPRRSDARFAFCYCCDQQVCVTPVGVGATGGGIWGPTVVAKYAKHDGVVVEGGCVQQGRRCGEEGGCGVDDGVTSDYCRRRYADLSR